MSGGKNFKLGSYSIREGRNFKPGRVYTWLIARTAATAATVPVLWCTSTALPDRQLAYLTPARRVLFSGVLSGPTSPGFAQNVKD